MSKKKKLIPGLRFPVFAKKGGWIVTSLSEVYSFRITNSFSRDNLNYKRGTVKNIHYGDIHTKFSTLFDITKETIPYINSDIPIDRIDQDNYCTEGDIVIADASEDLVGVGKSIEIVNLNNERVLAGLHTFLARQIEPNLIVGFGGYLFKSDSIRTQIQRESQGAKVLGISKGRIADINIYFPENKEEQQKIASCLSSLDELITAYNDKLEALKDHKKGLMQTLFPQEGEKVPKYRFPEFENDGAWMEETFEELFEIGSGKDYKHLEEGNIPVYGSGGYMLSVNKHLYNGESVAIGRKGTINNPLFLTGKFWTVDTLFFTRNFKNCIPKFIFYIFQKINWLQHNEAGGIPSLSKSNIYKIKTLLPELSEQKKIVESISSVDDLILSQENVVEELLKHKKGLMQGLFPKIVSD